jgi:hypothetical protein
MWPFIEDFADPARGPIHQIRRVACFYGKGGDQPLRQRKAIYRCVEGRETVAEKLRWSEKNAKGTRESRLP